MDSELIANSRRGSTVPVEVLSGTVTTKFKHLRRVVHLHTLRFRDNDMEVKYDRELGAKTVLLFRVFCIGLFLIFTCYYIWSIVTKPLTFKSDCPSAPDGDRYPNECRTYNGVWDIVIYGCTICLPLLGAFILTFCRRFFLKYYRLLETALIFVISVLNLCIDEFGNGPTSPTRIVLPLIIVLIAGHFLLCINFLNATINCFLTVIAFSTIQLLQLDKKSGNDIVFSIIYMLVIWAIVSVLAFVTEISRRIEFIETWDINRQNVEYRKQLSALRQKKEEKRDFAMIRSPLEQATSLIQLLAADLPPSSMQFAIASEVLDLLCNKEMMVPDVATQMKSEIDKYQKDWVLWNLLKKDVRIFEEDEIKFKNIRHTASIYNSESACRQILDHVMVRDAQIPDQHYEKIFSWSFSIFDIASCLNQRPLLYMSFRIFESMNFFEKFRIPFQTFFLFMADIEVTYDKQQNAYHNQLHAADVLQATYYFCSIKEISSFLSDLDKLSLLFAAIIHDVDHPGMTNRFLVKTRDVLSVLYNDRSCLENHHVSSAFLRLSDSKLNFLVNLSSDDWPYFRNLVIETVLATDLQDHFTFMTDVRRGLVCRLLASPVDENEAKERHLLLCKLILKSADISNPTRELAVAKTWAGMYLEEACAMGDQERRRKIAISPFCDRKTAKLGACQAIFIDALCQPLFMVLNEVVEIPDLLSNLSQNRAYWESVKQSE